MSDEIKFLEPPNLPKELQGFLDLMQRTVDEVCGIVPLALGEPGSERAVELMREQRLWRTRTQKSR